MIRIGLGLVVAGAGTACALMVVSVACALLWRVAGRRTATLPPRQRAHVLASWRLFPAGSSIAFGVFTLVAFLTFEPRDARETLGLILPAALAFWTIAACAGIVGAFRAVRQTTTTLGAWRAERSGVQRDLPVLAVDAPFPIVAVIGIWKPRLLVARQVVARCDDRELNAMIAHEIAHVQARDNLTRLLFAGAPKVPLVSGTFRDIEQAWIKSAEEAADDDARHDVPSALALASALTKVARMATGEPPLVHASAILSGSGVEHRVRRLLEPAPCARARQRLWMWSGGLLAAALALPVWQPVLRGVYEAAEYCVRHLP